MTYPPTCTHMGDVDEGIPTTTCDCGGRRFKFYWIRKLNAAFGAANSPHISKISVFINFLLSNFPKIDIFPKNRFEETEKNLKSLLKIVITPIFQSLLHFFLPSLPKLHFPFNIFWEMSQNSRLRRVCGKSLFRNLFWGQVLMGSHKMGASPDLRPCRRRSPWKIDQNMEFVLPHPVEVNCRSMIGCYLQPWWTYIKVRIGRCPVTLAMKLLWSVIRLRNFKVNYFDVFVYLMR